MFAQHTWRRGVVFLILASVSWGTVGVVIQLLTKHSITNAPSLAFLRLGIATPLFMLAGWRLTGRASHPASAGGPATRLFPLKIRDAGIMVGMGVMQVVYQTAFNAALPLAGVTIATLVALCVAPVIVALISPLMMRERLSPRTLLALVIALGGTMLLVLGRSGSGVQNVSWVGVALAFFAGLGYAGLILCGQLLSSNYHPLHINAVVFGTGALVLLCFAAPMGALVMVYPAWGWLLVLYLGCVPTALAYSLFQASMRAVSATVVSIVTLCEPLTAAILAWLFFREELSPSGLLGAGLLLVALCMILFVPVKRQTKAQQLPELSQKCEERAY